MYVYMYNMYKPSSLGGSVSLLATVITVGAGDSSTLSSSDVTVVFDDDDATVLDLS